MSPDRDSGVTETIEGIGPSLGEALAGDHESIVALRNGALVRVRAIRPDDAPRLMALSSRLSPRTVYQRFFSFRRLLPEEAHAFSNVDYRRRMAVVAEV